MFGARFDPSALESENVVPRKNILNFRKRRISEVTKDEDEIEEDQEQSESEDDSEEEQTQSESSEEEEEDQELKEDQTDNMSIDEESEKESDKESDKEEAYNEQVEQDEDYISKHKSIFNKFKKLVPVEQVETEQSDDDVQVQDLAPLPQPALPRDKKLVSTTTHLKSLNWLATPIYSSPSDTRSFDEFPLSPFMQRNLQTNNFTNAFSVQIAVLNLMLQDIKDHKLQPDIKGDILVNASTGSGKTLAYSIPIIESLHTRVVPRIRCIILVPTKPLINQVRTTLLQLSKGTNLSVVSLKNDISIKDEATKLKENVPDIIVSTPGRLVEHILQNSIDLSSLQFLVIDEADRLLNQSFQNWCQILLSKIEYNINITQEWKLPVQKLIFSATLTTDAGKLSSLNFQKPRLIIVNDDKELVNEIFTVPTTLSEFKLQFGSSKSSIKPLILTKFLISQQKLSNVLIFTKSNESSLRLSKLLQLLFTQLNQNINVTYMNSTNNRSSIRTKILKEFSNQTINILVATDLIARGLDLVSITDIINYDLPNSSREYVHRVGRTARANNIGMAYSLCFGKGETKWFETISKDVGRKTPVESIDLNVKELISSQDEEVYADVLQQLKDQLKH
ncbi:ATP-dependent RNA helicase DBP6 [Spathaspora sp. JA1]|nr:ATP-dependent RNA helicase DBP6 [Spathaspora sp. JA1]